MKYSIDNQVTESFYGYHVTLRSEIISDRCYLSLSIFFTFEEECQDHCRGCLGHFDERILQYSSMTAQGLEGPDHY